MSKAAACRLCLAEEGVMEHLFDSTDTNLPQKIMECTTIEVKNHPELPGYICEICKSELVICMKFRRQCLKANEMLKTMYPHLFLHSTDVVLAGNIPQEGELDDENQEELAAELYEEVELLEDDGIEDLNYTETDSKLVVEPYNGQEVTDEASVILMEIETGTEAIYEKDEEETVKMEKTQCDRSKSQHSPKKPRNRKYESQKVVFPDNRVRYLIKCHICGKDQQNIKQHMRVHRDERPYKCNFCERTFRQKGNYSRHINIHTGRKPYKCSICDAAFADPASLRAHNVRHTGSREYHCDVCGKSFGHSHVLTAHKRIHTQDRRHACTFCEKRFLSSHALKKHVRTHTGERPFKCKLCPKSFATSGNLRTHQRVHTKVKPFECEICKNSFSYKCVLQTHMKTHMKHMKRELGEPASHLKRELRIKSEERNVSVVGEEDSPDEESEEEVFDVYAQVDEEQDSA